MGSDSLVTDLCFEKLAGLQAKLSGHTFGTSATAILARRLKHKSVRQNTDEVGGLLHSMKDRDDRTLDASPRTLRGTSAGH